MDDVTQRKFLIVINKCDLPQSFAADDLAQITGATRIQSVSAKTGEGIAELKRCLRSLLLESNVDAPVVITNLRHRSALQRSEASLSRAALALAEGYAPEFVAMDLNDARSALEEITGMIQNDDILERIFAEFCIGK